jgi:hypothetical protein
MRLFIFSATAAMMMITSGCMRDVGAGQTGNVSYTVASTGTQVGIESQQFRVITSDTQFAALTSVAVMSGNLPSVDYTKDELIAVFLGPNTGCGTDGLSVEKLDESDSTVTVYVKRNLNSPPNGVPCFL